MEPELPPQVMEVLEKAKGLREGDPDPGYSLILGQGFRATDGLIQAWKDARTMAGIRFFQDALAEVGDPDLIEAYLLDSETPESYRVSLCRILARQRRTDLRNRIRILNLARHDRSPLVQEAAARSLHEIS
ncbi:MAG: hypothetical protein AB1758_01225 [Candidatus Eremiobacterota bacterium]